MLYKDDNTLNTFVRYTVTPDMLNVNWTLVCLWWNSTGSSNYTERSREGRQGQTGSLSSRRRQFRAGTRSKLVEVKTNSGFVLLFFSALKYDAAKEERYQQEAKQRELQRIEDALQMAARRGESVWPQWHLWIPVDFSVSCFICHLCSAKFSCGFNFRFLQFTFFPPHKQAQF